jgi:hypothetical protein
MTAMAPKSSAPPEIALVWDERQKCWRAKVGDLVVPGSLSLRPLGRQDQR